METNFVNNSNSHQSTSSVASNLLTLQEVTSTPEYKKNVEVLKEKDKVELHAHLGGAVSLDFLRAHSLPQEWNDLSQFLVQLRSGMEYSKAFQAFSMISKILNTNQRMEEAAFDFCRAQYNDKVVFSEIRTGLKKLDGSLEDYLKAVIQGLKKGMEAYPIQVNLVLSLRRNTSLEDANESIDLAIKYRDQGITGIDVSGESTIGDGTGIFKALQRAREAHLPITLHIGEKVDESAEQQMKELTLIQPQRIGHAVFLCPAARNWVEENQIVIEACIRSALSVSMITHPEEHPAIELFKKGHPVVFCTDDSTLFGNLSEELALVACLCHLSIEQVCEMQQKALSWAFKK